MSRGKEIEMRKIQVSNRLASYDRYRCDYCETWSGYGIGLCEKCGAPLPNKYVLTEP